MGKLKLESRRYKSLRESWKVEEMSESWKVRNSSGKLGIVDRKLGIVGKVRNS